MKKTQGLLTSAVVSTLFVATCFANESTVNSEEHTLCIMGFCFGTSNNGGGWTPGKAISHIGENTNKPNNNVSLNPVNPPLVVVRNGTGWRPGKPIKE